HRLLEAGDGVEALSIVRAEHPDLVIADVLMPTMDGYELVRQIRADPVIAKTRVVFYTAHFLELEARALAESCGVFHILLKPSEPEEILATVETALADERPIATEGAGFEASFDREHLRLVTNKLAEQSAKFRATNERLNALIDLNLQ